MDGLRVLMMTMVGTERLVIISQAFQHHSLVLDEALNSVYQLSGYLQHSFGIVMLSHFCKNG